MRYFFIVVVLISALVACQSNNRTEEITVTADSLVVDLHPLPELKSVDSIDMHFFPDINDQKVYSRIGVNDSAVVQLFSLQEIMNPFAVNPPCEYDTKFFCFAKGAIVKTLYVAAQKDSCHFIGYIKSGGLAVKISMSDSAAALVNRLREKSR